MAAREAITKARVRRGRVALVSLLDGGPLSAPARRDGVPLRCWDARSRVEDYLDDDLAPRDRAALERHLAGCPTCPALYAALVGVRARLQGQARRDPESVVPADVADRVRARLAATSTPIMSSTSSTASAPMTSSTAIDPVS